jgi:activator of HSP90 ATPase
MINKFSRIAVCIVTVFMVRTSALAQDKMKMEAQHPSMGDSLKSASIHQEVDFAASPERLYEALLDSTQFRTFSGVPAKIDRVEGGAFTLFGGPIVGRNIELVPNQRIVQAWRVANWPAGVYSIVKFEFKAQGSGTRLVFDHTGFPEDQRDHLAAGWKLRYWDPLAKYLH